MEVIRLIFIFAIGACMGSFLNVVVYRLPRGESLVFPPSHCPHCGRSIRWYDNIPLLSYLLLGRRCRFCKATISPRYFFVEAATAVLVTGLYVCYYLLDVRDGAGAFARSWPMYIAHAALLCGLLACSLADITHWIVLTEVCWAVALIGGLSAVYRPHPFMPTISTTTAAIAVGAGVGLLAAMGFRRKGWILESFLDVEDIPIASASRPKESRLQEPGGPKQGPASEGKITSVAITRAHGVNPRREILREALFLLPALVLAAGAYALVAKVPGIGQKWQTLADASSSPVGARVNGLLSSLTGFLVGGLWIWGARILGTLAFGKEAMGRGDIHIMAAVGAVTGWAVPSVAFFVAPFFGLIFALYLLVSRNQRELPYGPWLALASVGLMLCYDPVFAFFKAYLGPPLAGG